ncbi:MAG: type II toxin-antitoxin system VapC family toxin [Gemmatimonadota bacterium]|nr:type II toxin-antitoxin system VapC family toxin [Gemmatimonadota bacterium]
MIVLDTHTLIWTVEGDGRLGTSASRLIEETVQTDRVAVSAITPWEIAMLVERRRLRLGREVGEWIAEALALPGVTLIPIEPAIAINSVRLPGEFHADPADRFIVATARHLKASLLTADRTILAYSAAGHLRAVDAAE